MAAMDAADRQEGEVAQAKSAPAEEKFSRPEGGIASPWSRAFSGASSGKAEWCKQHPNAAQADAE